MATPRQPDAPAPTSDERELLLGYLRWKRDQVHAVAEGLTGEQLRWTPGERLLPIIGVVNHLTKMEWRWINGRYHGEPFPRRSEEFHLGEDVDCAEVLAAYRRQEAATEAIVRAAAGLDEPCLGDEAGRGPVHEILGYDQPVDLRWVLLHVLEETSHHCGHADATREMLDGTRMRG